MLMPQVLDYNKSTSFKMDDNAIKAYIDEMTNPMPDTYISLKNPQWLPDEQRFNVDVSDTTQLYKLAQSYLYNSDFSENKHLEKAMYGLKDCLSDMLIVNSKEYVQAEWITPKVFTEQKQEAAEKSISTEKSKEIVSDTPSETKTETTIKRRTMRL